MDDGDLGGRGGGAGDTLEAGTVGQYGVATAFIFRRLAVSARCRCRRLDRAATRSPRRHCCAHRFRTGARGPAVLGTTFLGNVYGRTTRYPTSVRVVRGGALQAVSYDVRRASAHRPLRPRAAVLTATLVGARRWASVVAADLAQRPASTTMRCGAAGRLGTSARVLPQVVCYGAGLRPGRFQAAERFRRPPPRVSNRGGRHLRHLRRCATVKGRRRL